ncbi:MAG: proton-conducting transporter membrane subunit [Bacteroidetes bacterium]|nr:proton-conducting transporter membrane subunit [Bacteroidota bacterium]
MENIYLITAVVLSFLILVVPSRLRYYFSLGVSLYVVTITSIPAVAVMITPGTQPESFVFGGFLGSLTLTIDWLTGFFILVTNFTALTGILYSRGYLEPYLEKKSPAQLSLHNFSYTWLHFSMLGVLLLREGISFLISWELMAVSSFMLILFEAEKRATLKTAVNYLIQMHIGLVMLVIAFLICEAETGKMSFDTLKIYFSQHTNIGLFLLFFSGFAIKAGFIPFHTWLPEAHPAAPSHVSGLMSGVMIKMGIYGIMRVSMYLQHDIYTIGLIVLIISVISGVLGVMMAIVQHDLKKLLAYHSIENIGIIGIGLGIGLMGWGSNNPVLLFFGICGGLLHVLNHSLFKSLLFFSAGSVYKSCHTRNIEQLGGVIHKMPYTGSLFLLGSLAICGLPPLNGFVSEILIYIGLFNGLSSWSVYQSITMILAIIALTMIGGLAIFCFTKAFSIVFLGSPRKEFDHEVQEVSTGMLFPQFVIAGFIILIGLLPYLFLKPMAEMIFTQYQIQSFPLLTTLTRTLSMISLVGFILILLIVILYFIRSRIMRSRTVASGPTWGCGYTAGNARQQYTGTSFATPFIELAEPILQSNKEYEPISDEEIFPTPHSFVTHPVDTFRSTLNRLIDFMMLILKKLARLQTGNIQHYILYAFIFIILIFMLLYLHIL